MKSDDIEAALVWRPGVLRSSKDPGALAFLNVLSLRPIPEHTGSLPDSPLSLAAASLDAELHGDASLASHGYEILAQSEDRSIKALGLCLRAWMQTADSPIFTSAIEAIEELPSEITRCSLYCKLMTFALDKGDIGLAIRMHQLAYANASKRRPMRDALDWVSTTYLGEPFKLRPRSGLVDPRVDVREIAALENESGRKFVVESVLQRSRSAWSHTVSFGRREIDELYAAELQSAWAGAMWKLREVRLHLGARILISKSSPNEIGRGVSLWILGGGKEIGGVFDEAERQFDSTTAESIVNGDLIGGKRAGAEASFPELCAHSWDLVNESTAERWLDSLPPIGSTQLQMNFQAQLWSLLSLRCTTAWADAYELLNENQKEAVVLAFPVEIGSDVSPVVSKAMLVTARRCISRELDSEYLNYRNAQILAEIIVNYGEDVRNAGGEDFHYLTRLPDAIRAILAFKTRDLAPFLRLEQAIEYLIEQLGIRRSRIESGAYDFPSVDFRVTLSMASIASNTLKNKVVDLFVDDARNQNFPTEERLSAMQALRLLVSENGGDDWNLADRLFDLGQTNLNFGPFGQQLPDEILRLWQLLFIWSKQNRQDMEYMLLSSSRHSDPRVRATAVSVASSIAKDNPSDWLHSLILAALYDPDREVLSTGIRATAVLQFNPGLLQSAVNRLKALMSSESRRIRAEICRVAHVAGSSYEQNPFQELNAIGSRDRSWLVRFESRGREGVEARATP